MTAICENYRERAYFALEAGDIEEYKKLTEKDSQFTRWLFVGPLPGFSPEHIPDSAYIEALKCGTGGDPDRIVEHLLSNLESYVSRELLCWAMEWQSPSHLPGNRKSLARACFIFDTLENAGLLEGRETKKIIESFCRKYKMTSRLLTNTAYQNIWRWILSDEECYEDCLLL